MSTISSAYQALRNDYRVRREPGVRKPLTHTTKTYPQDSRYSRPPYLNGAYFVSDEDREEWNEMYCGDIDDLVTQATYRGLSQVYFPTITEAVEKTSDTKNHPTGFRAGPFRIDMDIKSAFEGEESLVRNYLKIHPKFSEDSGKGKDEIVDTSDISKTYLGVFFETVIDAIRLVCEFSVETLSYTDTDYVESQEWKCIVTEKSRPRLNLNGTIKDGFHMFFPHLILPVWVSDDILTKEIKRLCKLRKVWKGIVCITPHDDLIDEGMHKKPWMMYGSTNYKPPSELEEGYYNEPYLYYRSSFFQDEDEFDEDTNPFVIDRGMCLTYRYPFNADTEEISWDEGYTEQISLLELFTDDFTVADDTPELEREMYHDLPKLLSIHTSYESLTPLSQFTMDKRKYITAKSLFAVGGNSDMDDHEAAELSAWIRSNQIMENISADRAGPHQQRMEIGWILYSIFKGHTDGFELWDEFCRRDPSEYEEGKCEERWRNEMYIGRYTKNSLLRILKHDNPSFATSIQTNSISQIIFEGTNEYHASIDFRCIAEIILKLYPGQFIVSPEDGNKKDGPAIFFYYYDEHRWKEFDVNIDGREMCEEVRELYIAFRRNYAGFLTDHGYDINGKDKDMEAAGRKKLIATIKALRGVTAAKSVFSMLPSVNKDEVVVHNFLTEVADRVEDGIVGCANGVLDLRRKVFRAGIPSDYNTFSTNRIYKDFADVRESKEYFEFREFMGKTFVDQELENLWWDFNCNSWDGNPSKGALIETGPTNSGKSVMQDLCSHVHGDYASALPGTEIIKGSASKMNKNNPLLARLRNKRRVYCPEIGNQPIDQSIFKQLAGGGDNQTAMDKYQSGKQTKEMSLNFGFSIQANGPPKLGSEEDQATFERVLVLPYTSYFWIPGKENVGIKLPDTLEKQYEQRVFLADKKVKKKIKTYFADIALSYMFHVYCTSYSQNGIRKIKGGMVETARQCLKANDDYYLNFVETSLVKIPLQYAYSKPTKKHPEGKRSIREFNTKGDDMECIKASILFDRFKEWYQFQYPSSSKFSGKSKGMKEFERKLVDILGRYHKDKSTVSTASGIMSDSVASPVKNFTTRENLNSIITGNVIRKKTWPHGVKPVKTGKTSTWVLAGYELLFVDEVEEKPHENPFQEAGPSTQEKKEFA